MKIKGLLCAFLALLFVVPAFCVSAEESVTSMTPTCDSDTVEVGDQFLVSFSLDSPPQYLGFQVEGNFDSSLAELVAPVYSQSNLQIIENTFDNEEGYFCLSAVDLSLSGSTEPVMCSVLFKATAKGEFKLMFGDPETGVKLIRMKTGENGEVYYDTYANDFSISIVDDTDGEDVWLIKDPDPITPYDDMLGYSWAEDSIAVMMRLGVLDFVEGTSFEPAKPITRGEFTDMLVKICKLEKSGETEEFSDVSEEAFYHDSVMTAKSLNIVEGTDDGRFMPDEPISRQDACVILFKTMKLMKKVRADIDSDKYLADIPDADKVSEYAADSVAAMVRAKIFRGDESGNINPTDNITRAEVSVVLNRIAEFNRLISL